MKKLVLVLVALMLLAPVGPAGAQAPEPASGSPPPAGTQGTQSAQPPAESAPATESAPAEEPAPVAVAAGLSPTRASWLSNRVPLRVGDVVTVFVEEQTAARERVAQVGTAQRSQRSTLQAVVDAEDALGRSAIESGVNSDSRDIGEAGREGGLYGTISVMVTEILPNGTARIEGTKKVTVDGREQEITLSGLIRPEDLSARNIILSSRIAGAQISYKGKKIGPRMGIVGKILSMLWP